MLSVLLFSADSQNEISNANAEIFNIKYWREKSNY